MDVNRDDADDIFQSLFEQLEGLSLSEAATDPWNINAGFEPLPSQFQKRAPPPSFDVAEVIENLDQLLGPEYPPDTVVYAQDQSVQTGSNKRIIAVDQTQHFFSPNRDQRHIAGTSTSINPTLQTGRSPSQVLFTVTPESIHFTPVGSSGDTCASADSNQQQPRKRQRR